MKIKIYKIISVTNAKSNIAWQIIYVTSEIIYNIKYSNFLSITKIEEKGNLRFDEFNDSVNPLVELISIHNIK